MKFLIRLLCPLLHGRFRTAYLTYEGMYIRCLKCGIKE